MIAKTYKALSIAGTLAVFLSMSSTAYAKDPCQSLICMAGKVSGGVQGNGRALLH